MHVAAAIGALHRACPGITADQVRGLIERGAIWAWNVASPGADTPELRLLTISVSVLDNVQELLDDPFGPCLPYPVNGQSAVDLVISWLDKHCRNAGKPFFTSKQIAWALSLGRTHVLDLVREKVLPQLPGTQFRQGPRGWAYISRPAVITFLTQRLEGGV